MDEKDEIFRMLDRRWPWFRALLLRQTGRTWVEIAVALNRQELTVKAYAKLAREEMETVGSLYFYLSTRARTWLTHHAGVNPRESGAEIGLGDWIRSYDQSTGLGPVTRNEILSAIDELYDSQHYRRQSS